MGETEVTDCGNGECVGRSASYLVWVLLSQK